MEKSKYEMSPKGIARMTDVDINIVMGVVMEFMTEDIAKKVRLTEEDREDLKNTIITGLRLAGGPNEEDFDFEKSFEIIEAFIKRFMKILTKQEKAKAALEEHGDLTQIFTQQFEQLLYGNWYNRKLIIQWFQKNSQRICDESPTIIKGSKYGRGVFASRDIKEGELIAYYPMDWVSDTKLYPKKKDNKTSYSTDQMKWICLQNAGIIGYGNPYDKAGNPERIMKELREEEGRMAHRINDYGFSFSSKDGGVHIWGDPLCHQPNSWFRGCIVNDGAYHTDQTKEGYCKEFNDMVMCRRFSKCNTRLSTRMTATRNIKKGEEIMTVYGEDYWFGGGENTEEGGDRQWFSRHHLLNLKSKGQKKKFKALKKAMVKNQREGFKMFREGMAEKCLENNKFSGFDGNKWRVCICDINPSSDGNYNVDAVIVNHEAKEGESDWEDGHPTQFSTYYPKPFQNS